MNYTIQQLKKDFPDDDTCLEYIFRMKYPKGRYYRVKGRKTYADSSGKQIYPLSGTIFENSSTPLTLWFYSLFLFASSKNGVSAMELQRQLGVTYKCAWRIGKKIREIMIQDKNKLSGVVEVDETYFGGRTKEKIKFKNKSAIMGMVERGGRVKAVKIPHRKTHILLKKIKDNVEKGSHIMSDELQAYRKVRWLGFTQQRIKHRKKQYVRGEVHTNTIEGFWSQIKRSVRGTYHWVSPQHLQSYLDEFAFRYNLRASDVSIFQHLLSRVVK